MDTEDDLKYRHMTELTILTVQLIVEFAKRIPGFEKLGQEDKITLLKVNLSRPHPPHSSQFVPNAFCHPATYIAHFYRSGLGRNFQSQCLIDGEEVNSFVSLVEKLV